MVTLSPERELSARRFTRTMLSDGTEVITFTDLEGAQPRSIPDAPAQADTEPEPQPDDPEEPAAVSATAPKGPEGDTIGDEAAERFRSYPMPGHERR